VPQAAYHPVVGSLRCSLVSCRALSPRQWLARDSSVPSYLYVSTMTMVNQDEEVDKKYVLAFKSYATVFDKKSSE
jgi:hypothetical protein